MHLQDDDPHAIRGLIAWLYSLKYDGKDKYATNLKSFSSCIDPSDNALNCVYLMKLYAAADKYEVFSLKAKLSRDIPTILDGIGDGKDEAGGLYLNNIARHIYAEQNHAAEVFRQDVIKILVKHMGDLSGTPEFAQLLINVPDLSAEIVHAVASQAQAEDDK